MQFFAYSVLKVLIQFANKVHFPPVFEPPSTKSGILPYNFFLYLLILLALPKPKAISV